MDAFASRSEKTGKRPRTVYDITDEGRRALAGWLDEPASPRTSDFEGMLKVFFSDAGDLDQLRLNLERIEGEAQERVEALAEMAAGEPVFPERLHLSEEEMARLEEPYLPHAVSGH